mmetsp:Transcript_19514/g.36390  ORF Transcript_19514/g.36390 Transcript_19514/m.36390 type:complete len:178 (-) Transcript_19514:16-549(-)
MDLPALHIVGLHKSHVEVMGRVSTAIHVTDGEEQSSLTIVHPAQQLRIHHVSDFSVHLNIRLPTTDPCDQWKPGSIILEHSEKVVFLVPSSSVSKDYWSQVLIKDFQWLRTGIPSPNFEIQVVTPAIEIERNVEGPQALPVQARHTSTAVQATMTMDENITDQDKSEDDEDDDEDEL